MGFGAGDRNDGVLVYRHDAQYFEAVGGYLASALASGGAAIALATASHLSGLEDWISICGTDLESAARERRYQALSIETVVDELDRAPATAMSIASPLREALAQVPTSAAPVHVFGEVAPALREHRRLDPSASLARVADLLRAERPVSLLCARHEDVAADTECPQQAHEASTVLLEVPSFPAPPNGADRTVVSSAVLPPAPAACRATRRLVRSACAEAAGKDATDTAELVASELAGNAVRHARSTFKAEVSFPNGSVRLAVTDAKPLPSDWTGFPIAREHGLGLIAAIASDWAVEPLDGGKLVWAELARV